MWCKTDPSYQGDCSMHARCLQGEAPRMPVRALICHEDIFIRAGIRAIIEKSDNIIVVGEFASAEELISGARSARPDIIMLGKFPGMDGVTLIREVLNTISSSEVILLSCCRDNAALDGLFAGARGLICNEVGPNDVIATIENVAQGHAQFPPRISGRLLEEVAGLLPESRQPPAAVSELSTRELEVLRLVANGISNSEISRLLTVSEATVRSHISHVLRKLSLRNRVEATAFAYRYGLTQVAGPSRI